MTDHPAKPAGLVPSRPAAIARSPLTAIREAIGDLDKQRALLEAEGDYESLARGSQDVATLVHDLSTLERESRYSIARVLDAQWEAEGKLERYESGDRKGQVRTRPKAEIEGVGLVEVMGGSERTQWQSEALLRRLLDEAGVNEDGERIPLTADRVFEVLRDCLPLTGSLSWRVGQLDRATDSWSGLRGHNVDPSEWCEEVEKPRIAKVPRRGLEAE